MISHRRRCRSWPGADVAVQQECLVEEISLPNAGTSAALGKLSEVGATLQSVGLTTQADTQQIGL
jgi:hypothetical protein